MQPTKSTTNDEKQKQNKKVRGLLAAALLVVALVLPIIENSTLGYAAEAQVSSFQFRYPNSVTFEEINQQFADYPYDTSLPDVYDAQPDIANEDINYRIGEDTTALLDAKGKADRDALAGSLSQETLNNALNATNFMRVSAGLQKLYIHTNDRIGGCQWRAQAGAALLAELGQMVHYVSASDAAAAGVSSGVFGWAKSGPAGSNCVNGYGVANKMVNSFMPDIGNDKTGLSHRSYILNPSLRRTGFGAANLSGTNKAGNRRGSAVTMFVTFFDTDPDNLTAVIWPAAKQPIETFRVTSSSGDNPYGSNPWSFFINTNDVVVNTSDLKITLTCEGKQTDVLDFKQIPAAGTSGSRLLVMPSNPLKQVIIFRPHVAYTSGDKVTVTIEGIEDKSGLPVPVTYDVHFFQTGTTPYPNLTDTSVNRNTEAAAAIRLTSDYAGTMHYLVPDADSSAPTADEVLAGSEISLGASADILDLNGLTDGGAKKLYYITTSTTGIGKDYIDAVKSGEMSAVRAVDIPAYSASGLIQYTVVYDWGTDVPTDQVLPTNSSKYAWEADARAAVDGTYTDGTAVAGSKNGKVGTWTFSGWDAGTLDADTGVITFHATWTFEAAAPSITVPYIVCKVGKAIKPVAMETVNLDAGGTWPVENLPAGLVIDPVTGVISGTPSVPAFITNLKVTYTAPDGTATHSGLQTVQVAAANHCLLTFETNGGTPITPFAWESGAEIPLSSFPEPTRIGYTFDGWFSDAELTTAITSVILDDDITVYAKWTPIDPITITFDPQNGTALFTETIAKGSKASAPTAPSKDGYTFKGWYTAADGGAKVDFTSATFDSDVTLYAQWEPVVEPSVTVPAINGRVGAPLTPVTAVVENAKAGGAWSAENLPAGLIIDPATGVISGTPTAEGTTDNVVFIYTDPDGKAVRSAPQRVVIAAPASEYTLTFDTKGGSVFASVTKRAGTTIDLSAYVPIKDGYTFDGWYTDAELTSGVTSVTLNDNVTVYAKWTPVDPVVITFDPQNGTAAFTQSIAKGSKATAPTAPSREGYTFKGWYTMADGGEDVDFASMTFDSAATLYAQWVPVVESSVTVPAISGRVGEALTPVTAVVVNAKAGGTWSAENLPAGLVIDPATGVISGTPTAEGTTDNVVFIYTEPDGKSVRSAPQRVTIAAPAPNYTLSFETKGGSVFASVTKKAGTVIDLSAYVPIKDGFTFDGWYSDPALTVRVTSVTLERNVLVYAKWLPAAPVDDIITITFDPRNGDPAFTEDIRKGTNAHTPPRPSRSGYTFRGWFTALIGGDRVDFDSMTFDSATTLYAHWEYTGSSSGGGSGSGGSGSGTNGDANTNNSANTSGSNSGRTPSPGNTTNKPTPVEYPSVEEPPVEDNTTMDPVDGPDQDVPTPDNTEDGVKFTWGPAQWAVAAGIVAVPLTVGAVIYIRKRRKA